MHIFVDFVIDKFLQQKCALFYFVISENFLRRAIFQKEWDQHFSVRGGGGSTLFHGYFVQHRILTKFLNSWNFKTFVNSDVFGTTMTLKKKSSYNRRITSIIYRNSRDYKRWERLLTTGFSYCQISVTHQKMCYRRTPHEPYVVIPSLEKDTPIKKKKRHVKGHFCPVKKKKGHLYE